MTDTDKKWEPAKNHRDVFAKLMARLAVTRGQEMDEVKLAQYFKVLGTLPLIGLQGACDEYAKTAGNWLPSAGDLFTRAVRLSDELWATRIQPQLPPPSRTAEEQSELEKLRAAKAAFIETAKRLHSPAMAMRLEKALRSEELPVYHCANCRDRGWTRTNEHLGQQWTVTGCACRVSNPVFQQHRRHV